MKNTIAAACLCAATSFAEPEITDFTVSQDAGSHMVTIDFTLSEKAIVTISMATNGVSIGPDNYRRMIDTQTNSKEFAANKVVSAGRHVFMWQPAREWPNHVFTNGEFSLDLKAWSLASPPDYMVVDLETPSNRWFYASAVDLPDGGIKTADPNDAEAIAALTNDIYRTTRYIMRRIPAAGNKWRMGSPANEASERDSSEVLHYVTLTEDYYIGIYPPTRWQEHYLDSTKGDTTVRPVRNESYSSWRGNVTRGYNWPDDGHAVSPTSIMQLFRTRTGLELDLPTEAQWEYACRAGTGGAFNDGTARYTAAGDGNALGWNSNNSGGNVMSVGLLQPNGWGLYDMHGNISEWCLDQYQAHPSTPQTNPLGAETNTQYRVVKGGSCKLNMGRARSAARGSVDYTKGNWDSSSYIGVRLCCPVAIPAE